MEPLRLGYASFVYYIGQKGHNVQCHAENHIAFWNDTKSKDEYDSYQVRDKGKFDCGYVVINPEDINKRFKGDHELIDTLENNCKREYGPDRGKIAWRHCKIPLLERENIKTEIYSGEFVECLNRR